ncbi:hypothetical protein HYH03_007636 [Edaphochlamys debaryana]|uniref:Uncharacterized protein n=1 Tax=Edaphochlamys debaryana TaxID=47281 RepID=A0A835Y1N2_9CHLO|nr:hypothetical protein HYH03_007636 [Edaphochlamys debaryana]|eukprot:KAG2494283.1 hypothetical protein HYH03_007636 [Edaphochlamys debaryana]
MGPSSERFWALATSRLVPEPDRHDMAVLLACLESIYRAEYQQLAGEAINAIAAANAAHVRPDGSLADVVSTSGYGSGEEESYGVREGSAVGAPAGGPGSRPGGAGGPGGADGAATAATVFAAAAAAEDDVVVGGAIQGVAAAAGLAAAAAAVVADGFRPGGPDGAAASGTSAASAEGSTSWEEEEAGASVMSYDAGAAAAAAAGASAADLDADALRRLLRLAGRAGYQAFTVRDVALADSLNADYLSQLFVKGSTSRLDTALVQECVDPSLPAEARSVLLLARGYGRELQAGRLLLQKLDYLQTLAVGQAGTWLKNGVSGLAAALFGTFEAAAGGSADGGGGPIFVEPDGRILTTPRGAEAELRGTGASGSQQAAEAKTADGTALAGTAGQGALPAVEAEPSGAWASSANGGAGGPHAAAGAWEAQPSASVAAVAAATEPAEPSASAAAGPELQPPAPGSAAEPGTVRVRSLTGSPRELQWQSVGGGLEVACVRSLSGESVDAAEGFGHGAADGLYRQAEPGVVAVEAAASVPLEWPQLRQPASEAGAAEGPQLVAASVGQQQPSALAAGAAALQPAAAAASAAAAPALAAPRRRAWDDGLSLPTPGGGDLGASPCGCGPAVPMPSLFSSSSSASSSGSSAAASVEDGSGAAGRWAAPSTNGGAGRNGSGGGGKYSMASAPPTPPTRSVEDAPAPSFTSAAAAAGNAAGANGGTGQGEQPQEAGAPDAGEQDDAASSSSSEGSLWYMLDEAQVERVLAAVVGGTTSALSGVYSALSDWGLVPRTDVVPLSAFNQHFLVSERPGRPPLYICKVSLSDAMGGAAWLSEGVKGLFDGLLREVQLQEPTFREVVVLYRPAHKRMAPPLRPAAPPPRSVLQRVRELLGFARPFSATSTSPAAPSSSSVSTSGPWGYAATRARPGQAQQIHMPPISRKLHPHHHSHQHQGNGLEGAGASARGPRRSDAASSRPHPLRSAASSPTTAASPAGQESLDEADGAVTEGDVWGRSAGGAARRIRGLRSGWLRRLLNPMRWLPRGPNETAALKRPPIQIRIYRDIPLPTWKVVLPEKLLQFRPLDLLRVDLFAVAGLAGLAAQARYDNLILDVLTFGSAAVLLVRIILGYQRMADRFRSVVNELLAEKALAGQEGAVEALAMAAAQQQLRQAALAYVLLLHHSDPAAAPATAAPATAGVTSTAAPSAAAPHVLAQGGTLQRVAAAAEEDEEGAVQRPPAMATTARLQEMAEWALATHSGVRVRFNACQALHELQRLGLVVRVLPAAAPGANASAAAAAAQAASGRALARAGSRGGGSRGSLVPNEVEEAALGSLSALAAAAEAEGRPAGAACGCCEDPVLGCDGHDGCGCADVWWAAVPLTDAVPVVEDFWGGLLWRRVGAILRRRDGL